MSRTWSYCFATLKIVIVVLLVSCPSRTSPVWVRRYQPYIHSGPAFSGTQSHIPFSVCLSGWSVPHSSGVTGWNLLNESHSLDKNSFSVLPASCTRMVSLLLGGMRSTAISVSVCRSVCLVCPLASLKNYMSKLHEIHVTCGRGSVILWRQCNMLCTSGFVHDVMFWHNGPNTDTDLESAT